MSKKQIYALTLKKSRVQQKPSYKIKVGKFQRTVFPHSIIKQQQLFNYELIIQRVNEPEIIIECFFNQKLAGTGKLKFDAKKNDQPNEKVQFTNQKKQKIGVLQCSLQRLQKKTKKPPLKIDIIQASYTSDQDLIGKMDPFVIVKIGDSNFQTQVAKQQGKTPVWKKQFKTNQTDVERIYLQSWQEDPNNCQFLGLSVVQITNNLNTEMDYDVVLNGKKSGSLKVAINQITKDNKLHVDERKVNDKNFAKKRSIKVYAVEAVMKQNVKKGGFIRISTNDQQYETTPVFVQTKQLKWNQSFTVDVKSQFEVIRAKLCIKDDIQQQLGVAEIYSSQIVNKKYELPLKNEKQEEIGKIYLQFYDSNLDIQEDINKSEAIAESSNIEQKKQIEQVKQLPKKPSISAQTASKIIDKSAQLKARYSNRQNINDYMANLNAVLQEGLLMVAKQRPEDPIKQLGLFLINYRKQ